MDIIKFWNWALSVAVLFIPTVIMIYFEQRGIKSGPIMLLPVALLVIGFIYMKFREQAVDRAARMNEQRALNLSLPEPPAATGSDERDQQPSASPAKLHDDEGLGG